MKKLPKTLKNKKIDVINTTSWFLQPQKNRAT